MEKILNNINFSELKIKSCVQKINCQANLKFLSIFFRHGDFGSGIDILANEY